jgi:hypothetical protein
MKGAQNYEDSKGYKTFEHTQKHGMNSLKHEIPEGSFAQNHELQGKLAPSV